MKHLWKFAILLGLGSFVYYAFQHGYIDDSQFHHDLFHIIIEGLK